MRKLLPAFVAIALAMVAVAAAPAAANPPVCDQPNPPPFCDPDPVEHDPEGGLGLFERRPEGLLVTGWATDPDSPDTQIQVRVQIDGTMAGTLTTSGAGHVFAGTVPAVIGNQVCVIAVNVGDGNDAPLGCRAFSVSVNPFGYFDEATLQGATVRLKGWAIDPDTADPVVVTVYVDNNLTASFYADLTRPDVGAAFPGYGDRHGFDTTIPASTVPGDHNICLYIVNAGPGADAGIFCRTYRVLRTPAKPVIADASRHWNGLSPMWSSDGDTMWVQRKQPGGEWLTVSERGTFATVPAGWPHAGKYFYEDGNLAEWTVYCYRVVAQSADGVTVVGDEYCGKTLIRPLPAVSDLAVTGRKDNTLDLAWTDNSNSEDGFKVKYRRSGDTGPPRELHAPSNTTRFTIAGLAPDTKYEISVAPMKIEYDESYVQVNDGTTGPPRIERLTVSPSKAQTCSQYRAVVTWNVRFIDNIAIYRGAMKVYEGKLPASGRFEDETQIMGYRQSVTYRLVGASADGRTTEATTAVTATAPPDERIAGSVRITNTTPYTVYLEFREFENGDPIKRLGTLAPGRSVTIAIPHCRFVWLVATDYLFAPLIKTRLLGHTNAGELALP